MGRGTKQTSPHRNGNGDPDRADFSTVQVARGFYDKHMKSSTKALATFVSSLLPQKPVVVTYFDEAHELKLSYWILLRLVASQDHKIPMWYVFMGTQSSITYFEVQRPKIVSVHIWPS
jgi:hypothetical protein